MRPRPTRGLGPHTATQGPPRTHSGPTRGPSDHLLLCQLSKLLLMDAKIICIPSATLWNSVTVVILVVVMLVSHKETSSCYKSKINLWQIGLEIKIYHANLLYKLLWIKLTLSVAKIIIAIWLNFGSFC